MATKAGNATPEATLAYAKGFISKGIPETGYRKMGTTGLTGSGVGFGGYRVDVANDEQRAALRLALENGCNVIDTSTNYADGASETCVGEVLSELINLKLLAREQVVVVSKVGYIQGQNLTIAVEKRAKGQAFPEVVEYMDGCWHCMHPDFIRDQVTRSLNRMGLESIDTYLLHNPEYFFSDAKKKYREADLPKLRDTFYERIERAFATLEELCLEGKIKSYGVSSNTYVSSHDDFEATSLTRMVEVAERWSQKTHGSPGQHRFQFIQLPANLIESGATLEPNNGKEFELTVLQYALEKNIAVLVNRPLNAIQGGALTRLADFPESSPSGDLTQLMTALMEKEREFIAERATKWGCRVPEKTLTEFFSWGHQLAKAPLEQFPYYRWHEIEHDLIRNNLKPIVHSVIQATEASHRNEIQAWTENYEMELDQVLKLIGSQIAIRDNGQSRTIAKQLEKHLPTSWAPATLSQKALGALMFTPGVTCVLNGMRRSEYVTDSLGTLKLPAFQPSPSLWKDFTFQA